jgi:hypothetical protein
MESTQSENIDRAEVDRKSHRQLLLSSFSAHFRKPSSYNTLYFPALGIPVSDDGRRQEVLNCFFPRADKRTDVTQNAIHHHGQLRLTSTVIHGEGYRHLTFSEPQSLRGKKDRFAMEILSDEPHAYGDRTIVEPWVPHAVTAPERATITHAVWEKPLQGVSASQVRAFLRKSEYLKRAVDLGKKTARGLGLLKLEYFDFFPADSGFNGMPDRVQYSRLSNLAYAQQVCHVLQEIDDADLIGELHAVVQEHKAEITNFEHYETLFSQMLEGRPISLWVEGMAYEELPHMMFPVDDIYKAIRR